MFINAIFGSLATTIHFIPKTLIVVYSNVRQPKYLLKLLNSVGKKLDAPLFWTNFRWGLELHPF